MAANFVPSHDRILLRRVQKQVTTKSGVVIPDTAKNKPHEAEVLAVGKGKINWCLLTSEEFIELLHCIEDRGVCLFCSHEQHAVLRF